MDVFENDILKKKNIFFSPCFGSLLTFSKSIRICHMWLFSIFTLLPCSSDIMSCGLRLVLGHFLPFKDWVKNIDAGETEYYEALFCAQATS